MRPVSILLGSRGTRIRNMFAIRQKYLNSLLMNLDKPEKNEGLGLGLISDVLGKI